MKFDNKTAVAGVGRKASKAIASILSKSKNLSDVVERWITTPTREVTFCNGVDEQNHFESLCIILKDEGRHVAERYLKPNTVQRDYPTIQPASSFVNWNKYFNAAPNSSERNIDEQFDALRYEESIGFSDDDFDELLALTVLNNTSGIAAALAHGLSPYCEATFSALDAGFFEGDAATIKRWGKNKLFWLFTTIRPPHPIDGKFPEFLESLVVDFSQKSATQKKTVETKQAAGLYLH